MAWLQGMIWATAWELHVSVERSDMRRTRLDGRQEEGKIQKSPPALKKKNPSRTVKVLGKVLSVLNRLKGNDMIRNISWWILMRLVSNYISLWVSTFQSVFDRNVKSDGSVRIFFDLFIRSSVKQQGSEADVKLQALHVCFRTNVFWKYVNQIKVAWEEGQTHRVFIHLLWILER